MPGITTEEKETRLQGRVFIYQMAHTVFGGEPDSSLFDVLASENCISTLRAMADGIPQLSALAEYCKGLSESAVYRASLERAESEYNRFVMGLGSNRVSHPWESAYTSNRRLLFQVETLEVRDAYRAFGYLPEMYPKVADDHIALECAFMLALAGKTLDAEGEEFVRLVAGQRDFLRDHMLKWVDNYASDLHEEAPGGLYDLMSTGLARFIKDDFVFLQEVVNG